MIIDLNYFDLAFPLSRFLEHTLISNILRTSLALKRSSMDMSLLMEKVIF